MAGVDEVGDEVGKDSLDLSSSTSRCYEFFLFLSYLSEIYGARGMSLNLR